MRIVQIEDFFHPDAGYQVNILSKYLVKDGHEVFILTSEMDKMPKELTSFFGTDDLYLKDKQYKEKYGATILRFPLKIYKSGRSVYKKNIFKAVLDLKPDLLYVHGNDTLVAVQIFLNYKKYKCPIISDSHMLEMASVNKFKNYFRLFYRTFVTSKIIKNKIKVIRVQDDLYVNKAFNIPLEQAPFISFGTDTLLFHPDEIIRKEFREKNNISKDAFVIIYAGKIDKAKGVLLLAQAYQEKIKSSKDVVLLLVGNCAGDYGLEVKSVFDKSENKILYFPTQKYEQLAYFYKASDLAVFPRQCSLSFFDVQACALPVLFENNSINVSRIQFDNGWTFEAEDSADLRVKLVNIIELSSCDFAKKGINSQNYIQNNFDYNKIIKKYETLFTQATSNFNNQKS